jgi:ABC-type nitrate/sulfonate/bicarbonate transport system substrate-binding protein
MNAIAPRFLFSVFFTTRDFAVAHREAIRKFVDVLRASAIQTNAHHDELAVEIAELVGSTPTAIRQMTWPTGGTSLSPAEMQPVIDISAKYRIIPKSFDAKQMIFNL